MTALLIATRNAHKVREIRAMLGEWLRYRSLADLPQAPDVLEDATTFAGNAAKKAMALAGWLSARPTSQSDASGDASAYVLADDSGLEVDALNGAPGVMSARFAAVDAHGAGNSTDADNNAKLLRLLGGVPLERRTARFRCVLALTPVLACSSKNRSPVCYADELELQTELFEGACEGRVGLAPRGAGGFGYDPLFVPEGCQETFAELGESIKNRISHRARALAKLKQRFAQLAPDAGDRSTP